MKKKGQGYGESPGRSWRVILSRNLRVSSAESVTFEKRLEGGKSSSWKHVWEPLHTDTIVNTNLSSRTCWCKWRYTDSWEFRPRVQVKKKNSD